VASRPTSWLLAAGSIPDPIPNPNPKPYSNPDLFLKITRAVELTRYG